MNDTTLSFDNYIVNYEELIEVRVALRCLIREYEREIRENERLQIEIPDSYTKRRVKELNELLTRIDWPNLKQAK